MAAALVSAEAALLFAIATDTNGNGMLNDEVRDAIENGSDKVTDSGAGKGRLNAFRATEELARHSN